MAGERRPLAKHSYHYYLCMCSYSRGGGGGGGGLRYDFGFYPSQNMEDIKKHRKTCFLNFYTKSNPPVQYP